MRTRSEKVKKRKIAGIINIYFFHPFWYHILVSIKKMVWIFCILFCETLHICTIWTGFYQYTSNISFLTWTFFSWRDFLLEGQIFDDWYFFFSKLFWHLYTFFFKSIFFHTSQQNIELETSRLWALFRVHTRYSQSSHLNSGIIHYAMVLQIECLKNEVRNAHRTFIVSNFSQHFFNVSKSK